MWIQRVDEHADLAGDPTFATLGFQIGFQVRATLSSKLRVPSDVLLQNMAGESVLLDLKSERYFGLDEVGTFLFNALRAEGSVRAAFDAAAAEYDVEPATLEVDLLTLVEQLIENGLVEIVP